MADSVTCYLQLSKGKGNHMTYQQLKVIATMTQLYEKSKIIIGISYHLDSLFELKVKFSYNIREKC